MIRVILNRVLVKPVDLKNEHKVEGTDIAIALIDPNENRTAAGRIEGTVVSIGETAYKDLCGDPPIKVGDYVVFAKYAGFFVKDPETGEELVLLNDEDVLCVISKGDR